MKRFILSALFCGLAPLVHAQSEEQLGKYRPLLPIYGIWDCETVGQDGGAISVQPNRLELVESTCELSNPVPIRDMDGILFEGSCTAEGETISERILLHSTPDALHIITPRGVSSWSKCAN